MVCREPVPILAGARALSLPRKVAGGVLSVATLAMGPGPAQRSLLYDALPAALLYAGSHKLAGRGCAGWAVSKCHVLLQSLVRSRPRRLRAAYPARPAGAELWRGHCCGLRPATAAGHQIWAAPAPASSDAAGAGSGRHATHAPAQYAAEHLPGTSPQ